METNFTIFYSWQSDIGGHANKSDIGAKIKKAYTDIEKNNIKYIFSH